MCEQCFSDDIPHKDLSTGLAGGVTDSGLTDGAASDHPAALSRRSFIAAAGAVGAMGMVGCSRAVANGAQLQHTVQAGETITSVASDYGMSIVELIDINKLKERRLRPGQTLFLSAHAHKIVPVSQSEPQVVQRLAQPSRDTLTMVSRAQWGAPTAGQHWEAMGPVRFVTLHHTDEHAGMQGLSDAQIVKNICLTHQRRGWADIGYHFLIGRDGRIYEGRRADRQGAHSRGVNNRNNLGISLIGNYDATLPNREQLEATRRFLAQQLKRYGLSRKALRGHREWSPTTCPGEALQSWLVALRNGNSLLPVA